MEETRNPMINLRFGDGLYHQFIVILVILYYCVYLMIVLHLFKEC